MSSNGDEGGDEENFPTPQPHSPDEQGGKPLPLPEEIRELLNELPERERDKVTKIASIMVSSHAGPLPDTHDFEHYERVLPGTASEIVEMAKKEQTIKEAVLTGRVSNDRLRVSNDRMLVWVLMVAVVGMIGVAGLAVWLKQPYVAMFLTGLSVIAGIALRLIGVLSKKKGDDERSENDDK